ncbi:hypothetical protein PROFUN_08178 [Planoprotostelium fungivorum]|uniref:Uncharacterized protein n=1 Tax=Planoprotostelium fungivorum TaxID=1890364 RepID=A0A2P6N655_9EUKA|nr:hypothetical protein PROFUN_08178 [Planoprotostelium fungivorum]
MPKAIYSPSRLENSHPNNGALIYPSDKKSQPNGKREEHRIEDKRRDEKSTSRSSQPKRPSDYEADRRRETASSEASSKRRRVEEETRRRSPHRDNALREPSHDRQTPSHYDETSNHTCSPWYDSGSERRSDDSSKGSDLRNEESNDGIDYVISFDEGKINFWPSWLEGGSSDPEHKRSFEDSIFKLKLEKERRLASEASIASDMAKKAAEEMKRVNLIGLGQLGKNKLGMQLRLGEGWRRSADANKKGERKPLNNKEPPKDPRGDYNVYTLR